MSFKRFKRWIFFRCFYQEEQERCDLKRIQRMLVEFERWSIDFSWRVERQLDRIEAALKKPTAVRILFFTNVGGTLREITNMQMKVGETKTIVAKAVDQYGNDAPVEAGSAVWSLTDPSLGTLVVDASGLSAQLTAGTAVGSCTLQMSADADLGAGVTTIAGELPVDILPGQAVSIQLSVQ